MLSIIFFKNIFSIIAAKFKSMKKNIITISIVSTFAIISSAYVAKFSTGKTDSTGSPGEGTCANCHSGGSGTTVVNVSFNPSITSGSYTPGQTYTITVNVINNPFSKFGFACEILDASNNNAGTMSNPGTGVQFMVGSNGRNVAAHTTPKTGTGSAQFTFEWTAPTSGIVNLYAIGNAVNGNGSTTGDKPSSTFSLSLNPDLTAVAINHPTIQSISVFPNPVKDVLNIQMNTSTKIENAEIQILDLSGKNIFYNQFSLASGNNQLSFNLPENISNGLYIINIKHQHQKVSKLMMIQK